MGAIGFMSGCLVLGSTSAAGGVIKVRPSNYYLATRIWLFMPFLALTAFGMTLREPGEHKNTERCPGSDPGDCDITAVLDVNDLIDIFTCESGYCSCSAGGPWVAQVVFLAFVSFGFAPAAVILLLVEGCEASRRPDASLSRGETSMVQCPTLERVVPTREQLALRAVQGQAPPPDPAVVVQHQPAVAVIHTAPGAPAVVPVPTAPPAYYAMQHEAGGQPQPDLADAPPSYDEIFQGNTTS